MTPASKNAAGAGGAAAAATVAAALGLPLDQIVADAPLLVLALWWIGHKADQLQAAMAAQTHEIILTRAALQDHDERMLHLGELLQPRQRSVSGP